MRKRTAKNNARQQQFISGSEVSIFDRREIIDKQNKLRKLYEACRSTGDVEYYDKIKYQQLIY